MSLIRRSLFISMTEQYLLIALNLSSFVVLARLLTPEEIGVFSVAAAFITLAHLLRDFGVATYLIQEVELTETRKRAAFTITLFIAVSIFVLLQLFAPSISGFYEDARIETVIRVLSFNFLLIPFNSITFAILRRELKFSIILWINLSSALAGTVASISFAYNDFGYLSLVYSSIIATATTAFAAMIYKKSEFFLKPTLAEWRRVFSFGAQITVARALVQIGDSINDLIIGKVLGFTAVGIISRAQGVMNIFHKNIMLGFSSVAVPGFSKANREGEDLEAIHNRTIAAITAIAWPFYGFLAIYSDEILLIMFGDQWGASADLVPYFCLGGAVATSSFFVQALLAAKGRADVTMKSELVLQPLKIVVLSVVAVVFQNMQIFCFAFMIMLIITAPVQFYFKQGIIATDWTTLFYGLVSSAKLTLLCLSIPLLLQILVVNNVLDLGMFILVALSALAAAGSWFYGLKLLSSPLLDDPIFPYKLRKLLL